MDSYPTVSVIVPTKNSQNRIEACLKSLMKQTYSNFEIIIVDGHSSDETVKRALAFPVSIFYENGGTRACACNVGIANAKGQIVAFTDDDCVVPDNWVEKIAAAFYNSDIQLYGGPAITPDDSSILQKAFGALQSFILPFANIGSRTGTTIIGCNSAYLKNSVLSVNGFNENLITTEETDLQYRIIQKGGKQLYDNTLSVLHYRRPSAKAFFKQFYRYGIGKGKTLRDHPGMLSLSDILAFLPFFFFPFLLFLSIFNANVAVNTLIFSFVLVLAGGLSLSFYGNIKMKNSLTVFPLVFASFFIFLSAESLGHFVGILSFRRSGKQ